MGDIVLFSRAFFNRPLTIRCEYPDTLMPPPEVTFTFLEICLGSETQATCVMRARGGC